MNDMTNWKKEGNIPHKDGKIKWYIIGMFEDEYHYLGEHDMTDWDKAFDSIYAEADKVATRRRFEQWNVVRKDLLIDNMWNIFNALQESGDLHKEWIDLKDYESDL